ncbi:cytochrome b/b6 domain-containing protein [Baaleninema sp.]|uniref:cytochrome b/b6 domain-containing protein n=1 Tax=Baaleninema sp. TaxID=3101197 RepID=UPI003D02174A
MSRSQPYQPSLLRLLHGLTALVILLALLSAAWVYLTYDGRLIQLSIPRIPDIIGIHGTFGVGLLLLLPLFALYSFHLGQNRLISSNTLRQLPQLPRPAGRYALHRLINTVMLIAATFALITGRMMKEEWLPEGRLTETWYTLHLWAWVVMAMAVVVHLTAASWAGGVALLRSMLTAQTRENDRPRQWWQQIQSIWKP